MINLSTPTLRAGLPGDSNHEFWTQDTEQGGDTPDVNRPPDQDVPDFGAEVPDLTNDPGAPPFTGEDLEGPGKRRPRKRPYDEPNN